MTGMAKVQESLAPPALAAEGGMTCLSLGTASPQQPVLAPPFEGHGPDGAQRATFAAGCFWGVEAAFRQIRGVLQTAVGYTGGHVPDPTYGRVCRHGTGHAEAVEVWFDPDQISYAQLLETFWRIHNPTTRNRQGFDFGSQYRSAIFYHDAGQQEAAISIARRRAAIGEAADRHGDHPCVCVLPG